jgi:hypothetical protein
MSKIQPIAIKDLYPTQLTVGLIEVEDKKKRLLAMSAKDQQSFLQDHPMPVVVGPQNRLFITDHHHLARAASAAGIAQSYYQVLDDLGSLNLDGFWIEMNKNQWVHPLDEHGVRHQYSQIPEHVDALVDDVYRSLAGYVRDAGGYDKTPAAFAEFVWADFFRRNIAIEEVTANFHAVVPHAHDLAKSKIAKGLPGFNG